MNNIESGCDSSKVIYDISSELLSADAWKDRLHGDGSTYLYACAQLVKFDGGGNCSSSS